MLEPAPLRAPASNWNLGRVGAECAGAGQARGRPWEAEEARWVRAYVRAGGAPGPRSGLANASTAMLQRPVGVRGPFGPFEGRRPVRQGAGHGVKMGLGLGSLGAGSWQLDVEVGR